jgi:membrane associated rhomboid family serine protease
MFAVAPLAPRVRLRVAPVATLALVVGIAAAGAWSLCTSSTGGAAPSDGDPLSLWGYRDGAAWVRAVSALFVHADAAHLLVNLVPLALAGACLEQVWGGAPTLVLFLAAGAVSIAFDARFAASGSLVVGASAGVSALLGACFVRFRHRRLRFAYVYLEYVRPRCGRFQLSCAAVGLLWATQQALGAAWSAWSGETQVAFASHLAGTAAGIAAACAAETARRVARRHP